MNTRCSPSEKSTTHSTINSKRSHSARKSGGRHQYLPTSIDRSTGIHRTIDSFSFLCFTGGSIDSRGRDSAAARAPLPAGARSRTAPCEREHKCSPVVPAPAPRYQIGISNDSLGFSVFSSTESDFKKKTVRGFFQKFKSKVKWPQ